VSDANPPLIRSEAEISDDERKYLNNVLDKTRIPENARNSDRAAIHEKIRTDVVDMVISTPQNLYPPKILSPSKI
jgi:hypothetical protein